MNPVSPEPGASLVHRTTAFEGKTWEEGEDKEVKRGNSKKLKEPTGSAFSEAIARAKNELNLVAPGFRTWGYLLELLMIMESYCLGAYYTLNPKTLNPKP